MRGRPAGVVAGTGAGDAAGAACVACAAGAAVRLPESPASRLHELALSAMSVNSSTETASVQREFETPYRFRVGATVQNIQIPL